ncbi:GTP-binding protein TypA [Caldithrix abyssi DSM 13497]|uniref:Large ribosomal subunit assembly factor BipA n=1 Tax=Caldithrix abyssi DSM 13497 TaxID=880073 RepID=H1XVF0_CALAY|nr:translational GTPase TypA [Caldithrix abyssi]APF17622.1 GTP-binding protein [Caldithrix abyssi DSM 13497]EHO41708.1 GTP-binding protein TypA [Caldithrix abyssi DSM 13497]
MNTDQIRNIAIIAHVDHGKTTLVDQLLRQNHIFRENQKVQERFLDSNDLERERGITILSKNISLRYKDVKINIIDTPGHADFSGEVERVLRMADGVLLLVDAFEGTMPQTRFVLQKALNLHLQPIVVINKMDRPNARPAEVLDEIYDLFIDLDVHEDLLDFPVVYASAKQGWSSLDQSQPGADMQPLMETIIGKIPPPLANSGSTQMQIAAIDYSSYTGRIGIGRVFRGSVRVGDSFKLVRRNGSAEDIQIKQLFTFEGLERLPADEVVTGDICAIVGIEDINIGDTIADREHPEPLPIIAIDEPTISMTFTINTSPFFGREGKYVTSRQLHDRLMRETESDVALRVKVGSSPDVFKVSGRGILHLSILMENMRREGYEFAVGQPRVIFKEIDGKKAEPVEELVIDVPAEWMGKVIEIVGQRKATMVKMEEKGNLRKLVYHIPSRGLLGLRNKLLTATSGEAVMYHRFYQYEFFKGSLPHRQNGVMISMGTGQVNAYALNALQDRGLFFVEPGEEVYTGQVVGEYNKEGDIVVNLQKAKKLTNMRAAAADKALKIAPAVKMSLEEYLEFIEQDELVEITPESIRIRKMILDEIERRRVQSRLKKQAG